ncbi:MAG: hypothetical protein PSX80_14830 [bacterium]|nr:hypothetical protein [bacterium]
MKLKNIAFALVGALMFVAAADTAFAQGGRPAGAGGGGGRPAGVGQPSGGGQPSGAGVDRGLGTASSRSGGRSDDGLGTASSRSNGRSDTGLERARMNRNNAPERGSEELGRYTGLSKKLGTTPEALRASYESALLANPDLTWGKFVSANVVADNLGTRYPNITSAAILTGLQNGDSLGRTLKSLGMGEDDAEIAEKEAKRAVKAAKKNKDQ